MPPLLIITAVTRHVKGNKRMQKGGKDLRLSIRDAGGMFIEKELLKKKKKKHFQMCSFIFTFIEGAGFILLPCIYFWINCGNNFCKFTAITSKLYFFF